MTPAVLFFFFFLSVMDGCLSAPSEIKNLTDGITDDIPGPKLNLKPPVLHGDIAVPTTFTRNADQCASKGCKWAKSEGYVQVPYYISPDFSEAEKRIIINGMKSFHQRTCIRFVPWRSGVRDYIHFYSQSNSGCWSYLGRQNGGQYISLEKNQCVYFSTVQHELLHALGFNHEQVRSDRDKYVQILFNNIQKKQRYNFEKKPTNNLGTPYDFDSVMHYSNYAFSSNGLPTILAKSDPNLAFGNARAMSANDIARVNKLYRCYGSLRRQKRTHPDVLH